MRTTGCSELQAASRAGSPQRQNDKGTLPLPHPRIIVCPAALPAPEQVPGLVDNLATLSHKGARIGRLLALLGAAAAALLPAHPQYEPLLQSLLTRVQMGEC